MLIPLKEVIDRQVGAASLARAVESPNVEA
jgi:hypothetical protein